MGDNPDMPDSEDRVRVGVVGAGAFGRNHARVYRDLQGDPLLNVKFVGVVDADKARAKLVASEFGAQAFGSVAELIVAGVDAVSVAVPTVAHLPVARELMHISEPTRRTPISYAVFC